MEDKRVEEMEKILNESQKLAQEVKEKLNELKENQENYKKLVEYYYSEEREYDISLDENGSLPKDITTAVLGEDYIYDLMTDYHYLAIDMLEIGTDILKN